MEIPQQILDRLSDVPSQVPHDPEPFVPTPNDPPWGSGTALGVWALSVLLILIVPSLFLFPYLAANGIDFGNGPELREFALSNPTAVLLQLLAIIPAHILTLAVAIPVVKSWKKYSIAQTLGFKMGGYKWWHIGSVVIALYAVLILISNIFPEQDNELLRMLSSSGSAAILVAVIATFAAPFVEELIYRGLLYSAFQRSVGPYLAVAIVTIMFAGIHFPQYWGSPGTLISITVLSLALTLLRSTSGNILPCVVLHLIFNGLQSVGIVIESMQKTTPAAEQTAAIFRLLN